jgi:hypothetical protein
MCPKLPTSICRAKAHEVERFYQWAEADLQFYREIKEWASIFVTNNLIGPYSIINL